MHSLLKRQLKKFFGNDANVPGELKGFVAAVNESYESFDNDGAMLHRAMELSSLELTESNSELRAVLQAIPDMILRLDHTGNIVALKAAEDSDAEAPADRLDKRRISSRVLNIPNSAIREQFDRVLRELLQDRQPKSFEYSVSTEFGDNFYEVRLMPLLQNDAIAMIQDITRRKQVIAEHERLNQELIKASRQAGMAEVATGVLHNVGNVLNSVNVSASVLRERLGRSEMQNLLKAANLLRDHAANTAEFLTHDPKGQRLPGYLIKLGEHLAAEQCAWKQELEQLSKNIEHIKEVVAMQQSYARLSGVTEAINAAELVADALRMTASSLQNDGVAVVRDYHPVPAVRVDKHKALQVLVNLIRNAHHAIMASGRDDKTLTLRILPAPESQISIQVGDNGVGIAPENLSRIFQHGFTTKKDGHGFGLHSSANAAREMRGNLTVHSGGHGLGATFALQLPMAKGEASPASISVLLPEPIYHHDI